MHNKVPEDVINEIIVHFVGPEGPRVNSYSKVRISWHDDVKWCLYGV